jgi:hypothetical protein
MNSPATLSNALATTPDTALLLISKVCVAPEGVNSTYLPSNSTFIQSCRW